MKVKVTGIAVACISLMFIGLMFTTQSSAKIDPKTITGLWLFDEGTGKVAKDSSGNGLDAKHMGNPKWVAGKFGKALEFDGAAAYVEVPAHKNPTKAITVSAWVKSPTPAWSQHGFLISKREAYIIHPNQGTNLVAFPVTNGGGWNVPFTWDKGAVGPKDITQWHMYTGTYDSKTGEWNIYIDGEAASNLKLTKNEIIEDADVLWIGRDQCCDPRFGAATIDEVAVFNVALGADDLKPLFTDGFEATLGVEPVGKLSTKWADIKAR